MAELLDGKSIAQALREALREKIARLSIRPVLACVLVGDANEALLHSQAQERLAQQIGIEYRVHRLGARSSGPDLAALISSLNRDSAVNGIIIQTPLPGHLKYTEAVGLIDPRKDAEGMHPSNLGGVVYGCAGRVPCTAAAVMALLARTEVRGREAVVVGHSEIVGKPVALLLLDRLATVTVCHIATAEAGYLRQHIERADILVVAVGKPRLIKGSWIKQGATVIDVGINRDNDKIVGDVEFDEAFGRAGAITPVPGGVGPVTVAFLLKNVVEAALGRQDEGRRSKVEG